jgi:hypothetical protein
MGFFSMLKKSVDCRIRQNGRGCHRRDGKVFAENDDLLCSVRYALMMLRYARTNTSARNFTVPINYPKWQAI